jgi:hypothetical protein
LPLDPKAEREAREAQWEVTRAWRAAQGTPNREVGRISKEKIREVAQGILTGDLYPSTQVRDPKMLTLVFLPRGFGVFDGWLP